MKIAVSGAAGRMGRRVVALAYEHPEGEISAALEAKGHPDLGKDVGELAGIGNLGVAVTDDRDAVFQACDVMIDFSAPDAAVTNARTAAKTGKALVVGTTGLSDSQIEMMLTAGVETRLLFAPNMSMGVNLLFKLVEDVASVLGDGYDVEIVEAHHKMKKDSPSGTAKKLAEIIADSLGRNLDAVGVHGRKGMVGERKPDEIGVMALRGGDIVGEHTVMFVTNGERIELTHRAHSRDMFVKGAIRGAFWLVNQSEGTYDMMDVLGLK
jgi:4-hydroxy-tetrahydrodipicolinate reductase